MIRPFVASDQRRWSGGSCHNLHPADGLPMVLTMDSDHGSHENYMGNAIADHMVRQKVGRHTAYRSSHPEDKKHCTRDVGSAVSTPPRPNVVLPALSRNGVITATDKEFCAIPPASWKALPSRPLQTLATIDNQGVSRHETRLVRV